MVCSPQTLMIPSARTFFFQQINLLWGFHFRMLKQMHMIERGRRFGASKVEECGNKACENRFRGQRNHNAS